MRTSWPCRQCRRDVCPDCDVEPSPCEHDDLCMDCWDTCTICHAGDVTAERYAERVGQQIERMASLIGKPDPYDPEQDPFHVPPAETTAEHQRTEPLRANYAMQRAECACGWRGGWHYYNDARLVEVDWAAHLEAVNA